MLSRAARSDDTLLLGLSEALRFSGMTAVLVRSGTSDISPAAAANHNQPLYNQRL